MKVKVSEHVPGANNLTVHINALRACPGIDYKELDSRHIEVLKPFKRIEWVSDIWDENNFLRKGSGEFEL